MLPNCQEQLQWMDGKITDKSTMCKIEQSMEKEEKVNRHQE